MYNKFRQIELNMFTSIEHMKFNWKTIVAASIEIYIYSIVQPKPHFGIMVSPWPIDPLTFDAVTYRLEVAIKDFPSFKATLVIELEL